MPRWLMRGGWWPDRLKRNDESSHGAYIQYQRCTGYSTSTSAIGWNTTWEHTLRKLCRSFLLLILPFPDRISKIGQNPPNRTLWNIQWSEMPVDISWATIHQFLYGPTTSPDWSLNIGKFDYRWGIVWSGHFQSDEKWEALKKWLEHYIAADVERVEWVTKSWWGNRKATLNFVAKLVEFLFWNKVSLTKADN